MSDNMPLHPFAIARAFARWGIYFIKPNKPPTHHSHDDYIIVATNYLTKRVEAKSSPKNYSRTTTKFWYEYVFTRYGIPLKIVSVQGVLFVNLKVIESLCEEFMNWKIEAKEEEEYNA